MNSLTITTMCLMTLALLGHTVDCWDQDLRDYILAVHNNIRRKPGACEMNKLEYDMQLEAKAREWATRCVFEHEMVSGLGENLAFNTNVFPEKKLIDIASDSWYNEIKDYIYGQHSCGWACHYTQLVWAKTTKVGCYAHKCGYLHPVHAQNAWNLVCFYTPKGNWNGEKPYQLRCPAKCAAGATEENGLCVGQPGTGGAAIEECKDLNSRCGVWANRMNQCTRNPGYMLKKCKKSCKVC